MAAPHRVHVLAGGARLVTSPMPERLSASLVLMFAGGSYRPMVKKHSEAKLLTFGVGRLRQNFRRHATLFEHAQSEYFLQNIPPMFVTVFQKTHLLDGHKRGTLQGASFSVRAHPSA